MSDSNIKREKTGKKGKRTGGGGDALRRARRGSRQGDRSGGRRGSVEAGAAASPRGNACCRECIFICIFILLNDTYCISRRRGTWDRRDRAREGSYKRTFLLNTFFFRIRHAEVVVERAGGGDGGSEAAVVAGTSPPEDLLQGVQAPVRRSDSKCTFRATRHHIVLNGPR